MKYFGAEALGLVETVALVPSVAAADKMLKAANVELIAFEAGGSTLCTVFVKGDLASCTAAVKAGAAAASAVGTVTARNVMAKPVAGLSAIVNAHRLEEAETAVSQWEAIGLVETFGVVYLMEAADAMCKAANVELIGYENIYDGYVSVLVCGETEACRTAVAAGEGAVRALGAEPYSRVVITAPHPELSKIVSRYSVNTLGCI